MYYAIDTWHYFFLEHHGVKGMKWGVRHGPPYPIEDTVLHKGQKINSVSGRDDSNVYKNKGSWMYTYNPNDKWDSKVYKGAYSVFLIQRLGYDYVYEHQFEVLKDLKMPTKKERIDAFIDLYKNNTRMVKKDMRKIQNVMTQYEVGSKEARTVDFSNLKTDADYKAAYEVFNHAMERADKFKTTQRYSKIMSTKYDAMVDDNNQGIYNEVHDPIIIFKANEALKPIAKAKMVDYQEIANNYLSVKDELNKKGKPLKL